MVSEKACVVACGGNKKIAKILSYLARLNRRANEGDNWCGLSAKQAVGKFGGSIATYERRIRLLKSFGCIVTTTTQAVGLTKWSVNTMAFMVTEAAYEAIERGIDMSMLGWGLQSIAKTEEGGSPQNGGKSKRGFPSKGGGVPLKTGGGFPSIVAAHSIYTFSELDSQKDSQSDSASLVTHIETKIQKQKSVQEEKQEDTSPEKLKQEPPQPPQATLQSIANPPRAADIERVFRDAMIARNPDYWHRGWKSFNDRRQAKELVGTLGAKPLETVLACVRNWDRFRKFSKDRGNSIPDCPDLWVLHRYAGLMVLFHRQDAPTKKTEHKPYKPEIPLNQGTWKTLGYASFEEAMALNGMDLKGHPLKKEKTHGAV